MFELCFIAPNPRAESKPITPPIPAAMIGFVLKNPLNAFKDDNRYIPPAPTTAPPAALPISFFVFSQRATDVIEKCISLLAIRRKSK